MLGPAPEWVTQVDPIAVPDEARGIVFIRRQQTEVHLSGNHQQTFSLFHAVLLHPNALQLGNVAISWNPAAGSPIVHAARIHRNGESLDVLADNDFEILRREDQLEAAMLDGMLTAILRVPDLRVGDEIEVAFTTPTADPTLRDRDYGMLMIAADPAPGLVQLRLSWDEENDAPFTRLTTDLEPLATRSANAITITANSAAPLIPPRDAPLRYHWQRILEFSDFENWPAVSARFDGLFKTARTLGDDSAVAREAARISRTHQGEMARARAALELVSQQVRYIYVGLNTGALTPASAEETWQRRYGDCKGKTALLLALLDELGIQAQAVFVNNSAADDGIDGFLPGPSMFDHVLVRATIDGQSYWLDGTLPGVTIPQSRPLLPYRWVLPLDAEGAEIERLDWLAMDDPAIIMLFDIDARGGFDRPAAITQTTITRGIGALGEYFAYSALTEQQLASAFRNELAGSTAWDTVETVNWRFDRERQASVLEISGTGMPDWDDEGNGRRRLTLPGGGFSPPQRRQRDAGQDQQAPFLNEDLYTCHVTTVRLPAKTEAQEWSYNTSFDTEIYGRLYRRDFERRDGSIRMVRISRTEENEVSPERAEADNVRLPAFDNSMARIEYDPGDSFQPRGGIAVPAIYEIDWLENHTACDPDNGFRG